MDLFEKSPGLVSIADVVVPDEVRHKMTTFVPAFDEALGGGLVRGESILFGGDPGVGKTTFLLQVLSLMGEHYPCVYNSAEEDASQLKLTFERIRGEGKFLIGNIPEVSELIDTVRKNGAHVLVVDSIQGLYIKTSDSPPGSTSQLREACNALIHFAKTDKCTLFIICQMAKDGTFKGPNDLSHNVDAVAKLTKGTEIHRYRLLTLSKNRFGPTGREKRIRWSSGRYVFSNEGEEEPVVEASLLEEGPLPDGKTKLHPGKVVFGDRDKVIALATAFRDVSPTIDALIHCIRKIRSEYGSFHLGEEDQPLFGCSKNEWVSFLHVLGQNPSYRVLTINPIVLEI